MKIIDFHSHILPGIDDGSRNTEMTEQMLHAASAQGIQIIAATPHFYADSMRIDRFLTDREQALKKAQPIASRYGLEIVCGAEVAYFSGMSRAKELNLLRLADTDLMLLEMPFRAWSKEDLYEVELILHRGIRPIIAHLERFYQFQTDRHIIPQLLELPVYVQLNAECMLNGRKLKKLGLKLFRNGQAHLLGSDCHNVTSRQQNLAQGRAALAEHLGERCLEHIDALGTRLLEGKD